MGDLPQMHIEKEEEVPALVDVAVANSDEDPVRSATTQLRDSNLAKVPLTIVTGTRTLWNVKDDFFLKLIHRLSRRWKDYVGELCSKSTAWQEDCSHP